MDEKTLINTMHIILSYFDSIIGPSLLFSVPPLPDNTISETILKFMDSYTEESFFEHNISNTKMQTYNYIFEIPSDWARGSVETLMISVVHDQSVRSAVFKPLMEQFAAKLKREKNLFKAFYMETENKKDPEVKKKYDELSKDVKDFKKNIEDKVETSKTGLFLTLGVSKAGKSCILNYLREKKFLGDSRPTLYTEIMQLVVDSYKFNAYDVGGQERLRVDWWNLPRRPDAIIWVCDITADKATWKDSKKEFEKMIQERVGTKKQHAVDKKIPLLICANKIDLKPDYDLKKVISEYKLDKIKLNYKLQPTSSVTGEGIEDGFRWIVSQLMVNK